jgi:hypothetical protein
MAKGYSELRNELVSAANGVDYAYRDTGGEGVVPLVLLQHFRWNLDNWDPALIDALAPTRRVVTFDNAGVGGSTGTTPDTIEQMARDASRSSPPWSSARSTCSASPSAASSPSRSRWCGRRSSAGWSWPPRRLKARPACTAGRRRSSARSAHRPPARGLPGGVLHPVSVQPASRPGSTAAHVRQDRGPRPGHDVGNPRGAV